MPGTGGPRARLGDGGLLFSEGESTIVVFFTREPTFRGSPRRNRSRRVLRPGEGSAVMSHRHGMVLVMAASLLTMTASVVRANVFSMPNSEASVQFVPVGDPGNAARPGHRLALRLGRLYVCDGEIRCDRWAILPVPQRGRGDRHLRAVQQLHGDVRLIQPSGLRRAAVRAVTPTRFRTTPARGTATSPITPAFTHRPWPRQTTHPYSTQRGAMRRGSPTGCKTAAASCREIPAKWPARPRRGLTRWAGPHRSLP